MKTFIALTVCAGTAFAGTASIVASYTLPIRSAQGMDYHDGYIYTADSTASYERIYKVTTTGTIVQSLNNFYAVRGIARTNFEFWGVTYLTGYIYRLSTAGSFLRSFKGPGAAGVELDYDEGFLWYSAGLAGIYKLTVNGSVVTSFNFPDAWGISSDNGYMWVTRQRYTNNLWQLTQSGSVVDYFTLRGDPDGVTWEGSYLWYSSSRTIYKATLSYTAVEPASLGKVKAVYR